MNTADLIIHIHPELNEAARKDLEKRLEGHIGIDCAEFNHHPHPHSLVVKYDPDAIQGTEILKVVRQTDPAATMSGL